MDETNWVEIVASGTCAQCGLDASGVALASLPGSLRTGAAEWSHLLSTSSDGVLRSRPVPGWSALEYGAHVRDVLERFADRVERVLVEDEPVLGWWDHEAAVVDEAYNAHAPQDVAVQLCTNAERLASLASTMDEGAWSRAATRRPGERFTVEGLVRFALHELCHHKVDADLRVRA